MSTEVEIHEDAINETLQSTYYELDGLVEISNTNSEVLFSFHTLNSKSARLEIRQYLGVLGDVVAKNLDEQP